MGIVLWYPWLKK